MVDLISNLGGRAGFGESELEPNDDGSSGPIDITDVFGSGLNFYGQDYDQLYVNNNGNVTFEDSLGEYTPFGITESTIPIIAAYFADVDTTGNEDGLGPTPGAPVGARTPCSTTSIGTPARSPLPGTMSATTTLT